MKNKRIIIGTIVLALLCIALGITAASLFSGGENDFPPPASSALTPARPVAAPPPPVTDPPDGSLPSVIAPVEHPETGISPDEDRSLPESRRGLTQEEAEESRREIARMKEALPGNMWIPEDPRFGYDPERGETLGKTIVLESKIRNSTATREEQVEYYTIKMRSVSDRIDLIRYIADRTGQMAEETGKSYLTEEDTIAGDDAITEMEAEIAIYREKLDALGE